MVSLRKNTWFQLSYIVAVGVFGIFGACVRYAISFFNQPVHGLSFPWGTLCINLIGCLVLAYVYRRWAYTQVLPEWFRVGFATGFIGSFTTFSTFSVEWVKMLEHEQWLFVALYSGLSLLGGLGAIVAGFELGRRKGTIL